ncbi:MAG: DNA polymerase III subunit alpha [Bacilli bacterium]|nr:DNA polymerase III subunit alpha [Bacilli bacterium]
MNYVPLNIKTHYSLLSSMIKIDDLINFAKENKIKQLTITDNNMYGVMEFYKQCLLNNIKPIVGLEIKIDNLDIILYCCNYEGYKNLIKINSLNTEGLLTLKQLQLYSENLICIVPYLSTNLYSDLKKVFQYIFQSYKSIDERNKLTGNNLIYMNEIIYLIKEDKNYINYLLAIKDGKFVSEINNNLLNNYLMLFNEVSNKYPNDIINNYKINELCNLELKFNQKLIPSFECPKDYDSYTYIKKLCIRGLKQRFGNQVNRIYIDRLNHELEVINNMGFCDYFLIVWDYVKYAKEQGILVGPGRGSAAGSLVSYLLNITDVDPIKYNLLFERFLNPERITMPDIDIDFEYNRREEVINYCINKYGIKRVAPIITFGTLGSKQVIRDVARTLDIDLEIVDYISKMLQSKLSLVENYKQSAKLKNYLDNKPQLMTMYKVASKLEGLKRHSSVHAAGIVMSNIDLDEIIPLDKKHEDFYTTGYDMDYLEDIGLLKMDFLGIKNLTLITDVIKDIKEVLNVDIDFDNIPLNDQKALEIFTNVNTTGIFQFESNGMKNFLRKLCPTSFEEIVAANALFRPGPMENIETYIKRKQGSERIEDIHPDLTPILKSTYGIIIYQEQIMQIAKIMAGYSFGEADLLRRAMSKKQESVMIKEQQKFVDRSTTRGYSLETANEVYDLILKFASYGFNRSHSVAYSIIAYKMAYLKAHYPLFFMKALLSMVVGSEIKTKEYIYECKNNNILIIAPDINLSDSSYKITDKGIIYPLSIIKNIGGTAANTIIKERQNGVYKNIYDFIKRVYGRSVNKKTIVSLINAGCFNSIGLNKRTITENLDIIINYGELIKDVGEEYALQPEINHLDEYSKKELMRLELESFSFYISNHPVTEYKNKYPNPVEINNLKKHFDKVVEIIVYVDGMKEVKTKKGDAMCFITGSDELSSIDIVLFPKVYNKYSNIEVGNIIKIFGKVEKRFDKLQIIANEIEILD